MGRQAARLIRWGLAGLLAGAGLAERAWAETPDGPAYTGCTAEIAPMVNADFEQQVVELVNQQRLANGGLAPLKRVTELDQAARYHAEDMRADNYFKHDSYDGVGGTTLACAWNVRLGKFYASSAGLAENIAWGYGSPASVMDGWMTSSGHRGNILTTSLWELGVGYASGNVWVQDFGRKSGRYPLIINREAAETASADVALYIYSDTGATAWTHMRLKNDTDAGFGPWQPFQNSFNWTLGAANGTRSVTVELSRNGGSTVAATATDTILLNGVTVVNALGSLPGQISFLHDLRTGRTVPASNALALANTGGAGALTWSAAAQGGWFNLSSAGGVTPAALTITPATFGNVAQTYTGAITVTVTSPGGVANSPQRVDLSLVVAAQLTSVYLPAIQR